MNLVEQHVINKNHILYSYCDQICYQSKNLYNLANYHIRQEFINNNRHMGYGELENSLKYAEAYKTLQSQTSQQILQVLEDINYEGFFAGLKEYKINPSKFTGKPKLPKYKHKTEGRNIVIFTNQQCQIKSGKINFPYIKDEKMLNMNNFYKQQTYMKSKGISRRYIKTKLIDFQQIRITPQTNCYLLEIVYQKDIIQNNLDPLKRLSIDLGINNFATCVNNAGLQPFIINGKPLKSINQYFNKQLSLMKSELMIKNNLYSSNATQSFTLKRNNKVKDFMHKASRYLIDYCVENRIGTMILGYNEGWKFELSLGKRTNQNFSYIPYALFKKILSYKCELNGIKLILTEESYTSKCSFIDNEAMHHHTKYLGYRKHRGMFVSGKISNRTKINADIQGAYNIMRKVFSNFTYNPNLKTTPYIVNLDGAVKDKRNKPKKKRK